MDKIKTYLDYLYNLDYNEHPVSIDEFLDSSLFLGKMTNNGKSVRPVWRKYLRELMEDDKKWQIVFTGAIGTGKSRAAIWGLLYVMHRILCLKNPWKFFGSKAEGGLMTIAFFNLVKSQSQSRGYKILQSHLVSSPWFLEKGFLSKSCTFPTLHIPLFEFKLASPYSKGFGIQGDDIIAGILDELDAPDESEAQKKKVISAYDSAVNRFKTRFVIDKRSLGRLFLVASKQETLSFLNTFISERQNDESVRIIDIPLWEALPNTSFCGEKFNVLIGDVYTPSKIIESKEEQIQAQLKGYNIIQVPIEFYEDFKRDIVKALRDIGGIAVTEIRKKKLFPSEKIIRNCYDPERKNPVSQQTIKIGLQDNIDLINFIDLTAIRQPPNIPRCIHWDISLSDDSTGIAMSGICGWKKVYKEDENGNITEIKQPVVETDFALRLQAKDGDQIPFNKIRSLLIELKKVYNFNIICITADLNLLSADSRQTLTLAGLKTEYLSLDKKPELYRSFRNLVADNCWICPYIPILHFELVNLEDDTNRNKIDHPDKVPQIILLDDGTTKEVILKGSKDVADAVVGSVMKAIELCATPPDVEIMTNLMKKSVQTEIIEREKQKLLVDFIEETVQSKSINNIEEQKNQKDIFKQILKRAIHGC